MEFGRPGSYRDLIIAGDHAIGVFWSVDIARIAGDWTKSVCYSLVSADADYLLPKDRRYCRFGCILQKQPHDLSNRAMPRCTPDGKQVVFSEDFIL